MFSSQSNLGTKTLRSLSPSIPESFQQSPPLNLCRTFRLTAMHQESFMRSEMRPQICWCTKALTVESSLMTKCHAPHWNGKNCRDWKCFKKMHCRSLAKSAPFFCVKSGTGFQIKCNRLLHVQTSTFTMHVLACRRQPLWILPNPHVAFLQNPPLRTLCLRTEQLPLCHLSKRCSSFLSTNFPNKDPNMFSICSQGLRHRDPTPSLQDPGLAPGPCHAEKREKDEKRIRSWEKQRQLFVFVPPTSRSFGAFSAFQKSLLTQQR